MDMTMQQKWKRIRLFAVSTILASAIMIISLPAAAETLEELKASMEQMQQAMRAMEQRIAVMEKEKAAESSVQVSGNKSGGLQIAKNTTLSIYGYTKLDVLYTDTGGGGKYNFVPKLVPLDAERDALADNAFTMHARESRIGFATGTATEYGQFNTRIEADFYGSEGNERTANSHGLRLRLAYAELGNLRVGQDWSTFVDSSAYPEYVDFGHAVGRLFVLQPLIRWTQPFTGGSLQFALENPEAFFLSKTAEGDGRYTNTTLSGNGSDEYIPELAPLSSRISFLEQLKWGEGSSYFVLSSQKRENSVELIDCAVRFSDKDMLQLFNKTIERIL